MGLRHPDPHRVLGIHPASNGALARVFRPEATAVDVLPDDGGRFPLAPLMGYPGVFEGKVPGKVRPYSLEVKYGKSAFTFRDPYAFLPTLGEQDLHYLGEGNHYRLWERLGAHPMHHQGVAGVAFAVWAPAAEGVSVVGDFNNWDGRLHAMRAMGSSGIWELFIPELAEGTRYKLEIRPKSGTPFLKADPFAFRTEVPPQSASIVHDLNRYRWGDSAWLQGRAEVHRPDRPLSIYEVHAASFRRVPEEDHRSLTWRELATHLSAHAKSAGFTHVELLPIAEHPFGGSWGYQVSSYFAPTARFGHPDDFRWFVDTMHQQGLGVIVDWVPGHFPRDAFALGRFDGTALYEHEDPREGAHPDWGTLIFNFGRNEVRNFLIANALFWFDQYHVDGLRVDAVASMLYRDYSRKAGEWVPNRWGGRENEEAIEFMRHLNAVVRKIHPDALMIAEESTAWPKVSRPVSEGGLGFTEKWNMGWMHDTLSYFSKDPLFRKHHHNQLTFGTLYAWSEDFVLPLSHDEVVHGKGSLLNKMSGDEWQRFANLRALYTWMWAHPGKKLLFMGQEIAQGNEWNNDSSIEWHLLQYPNHQGILSLVTELNRVMKAEPALHQWDFKPEGFQWVQADARDVNCFAFLRRAQDARPVLVVANLAPVVREGYRVGCPQAGKWRVLFDSDGRMFGGAGVDLAVGVADTTPWDGQPCSLTLTLPPLGVVWLVPE
ncbi:MAG: 1,4-alpha-glucan branching protein GlgB [Archangiaceae bacterium]|nr:1,4-alpha-glucan branching protein GlgB [Archangiaceae bacterium]